MREQFDLWGRGGRVVNKHNKASSLGQSEAEANLSQHRMVKIIELFEFIIEKYTYVCSSQF